MKQTKTCKDCSISKDVSDFYVYKESGNPRARCKQCASAMSRNSATKEFRENRTKILTKKKMLHDQMMRECGCCREAKSYESFYKHRSGRYLNRCKTCMSVYNKTPEVLQRKQKYDENYKRINREKILDQARNYSKTYRNKFSSKTKEANKEWRKNNPLKVKELMKKFRDKNKSRPLYRIKVIFSQRIRKVAKKSEWRKMKISTAMLGCSFEEFRQYIQSQFTDGMHWNNYGIKGWHLDHKFPVSACKTEEDLIRCYHYKNFQPLWWKDNIKKGNKILDGVALP